MAHHRKSSRLGKHKNKENAYKLIKRISANNELIKKLKAENV
jgi:hypothetical protein